MKLFLQYLVICSEILRIISIPCIPKDDRIALIIGQDYGSVLNYTKIFSEIHPQPFGFMAYTTLNGSDGPLAGLENAIDYGSGIEWTEGIIRRFPRSSIQLGLYLVNQLDAINTGQFDPIILRLVNYVKRRSSIADFYLRIGYEFDNPDNHYDPPAYRLAFQRIVRLFREKRVDNVLFVWHSMGELPFGQNPDDSAEYFRWFPGTEFVDLCGVSIFQQPFHCNHSHNRCYMKYVESFSLFCREHFIPLMIAESAPFGGIITKNQEKMNSAVKNRAGYGGNSWDMWFIPVLNYISIYDVRIWSYINCDWDMFPIWQKNHAPGIYWGDSRVEGKKGSSNLYIFKCKHLVGSLEMLELWKDKVLNDARMLLSYQRGAPFCEAKEQHFLITQQFAPEINPVSIIGLIIIFITFCFLIYHFIRYIYYQQSSSYQTIP